MWSLIFFNISHNLLFLQGTTIITNMKPAKAAKSTWVAHPLVSTAHFLPLCWWRVWSGRSDASAPRKAPPHCWCPPQRGETWLERSSASARWAESSPPPPPDELWNPRTRTHVHTHTLSITTVHCFSCQVHPGCVAHWPALARVQLEEDAEAVPQPGVVLCDGVVPQQHQSRQHLGAWDAAGVHQLGKTLGRLRPQVGHLDNRRWARTSQTIHWIVLHTGVKFGPRGNKVTAKLGPLVLLYIAHGLLKVHIPESSAQSEQDVH